MFINMGAWTKASMLLGFFIFASGEHQEFQQMPVKRDIAKLVNPNHGTNSVNSLVISNQPNIKASESSYSPYSVVPYSLEDSKTIDSNLYSNSYPVQQSSAYGGIVQDFSSIEVDKGSYNDKDFQDRGQFLDTTGYKQYGSQTSFNLEGPKQLEIIETKNFHKEVEPYGTEDYKKYHHKEEEEHAEVHYHQHKHLHKHKHKQEHNHKHKEEHIHEHDHKHQHKAQHEHKHKAEHQHWQNSNHKHEEKSQHEHKHKQEHKHDHHHAHKHEHKSKEDHKHEQYHKHKHEQWSDHKHKHYDEHKHDHHHGHKHWNDHKHEHKHQNHHDHKHGHKHEQKHQHYEKNYHSHYKSKW